MQHESERSKWRRQVARWGLRLLLIVNWGQVVGFTLLWLSLVWHDTLWLTDFLTFYSAGRMVLAGDGAKLYDPAVLLHYEQATIAGRLESTQAILYLNPPHVALVLAPLGLFTRPIAYLIWTGLELGLLMWAVRLTLAATPEWSRAEHRLLIGALLAFPPLLITVAQGTLSLLLLVCLWQVYHGLRAGRPWLAGLWLGGGLLKPQLWLLLIVMLLITRRWSVLGGAGLVVGGLAALSSLVLGWRTWLAWLALIQGLTTQVVPSMVNLRAVLGLWVGADQAELITILNWAAVIAAAAGVAWLWRRPLPPAGDPFTRRLALTITLGLLVTPYLYSHDSVLLVVPATLGYQIIREQPLRRWYAAFGASAPLLVLVGEEVVGNRFGIPILLLLMAVLAGWLVAMNPRETRSQPTT